MRCSLGDTRRSHFHLEGFCWWYLDVWIFKHDPNWMFCLTENCIWVLHRGTAATEAPFLAAKILGEAAKILPNWTGTSSCFEVKADQFKNCIRLATEFCAFAQLLRSYFNQLETAPVGLFDPYHRKRLQCHLAQSPARVHQSCLFKKCGNQMPTTVHQDKQNKHVMPEELQSIHVHRHLE